MIVLTNTEEITVQPGSAVVFNDVVLKTVNGAECFRDNTGVVGLRAINGVYEISFSGNIGGETADTPVQLQMMTGTAPLPETVMVSTPASSGALNNVAKSTYYKNCMLEFSAISVVNTGSTALTLGAGSSFTVKRVA